MAPRFVELVTPVEDGVKWATSLPAFLSNALGDMLAPDFSIPDLNGVESVVDGVSRVPAPRGMARLLLVLGAVAALLRLMLVRARFRYILAQYGHHSALRKDL